MAIENGVQNAELGYILDPAFQIENLNGKPVVGGYICIYEAGTDNKYISYENFDGAQNPFKIPLKADGRAVILGDPSLTYDVYAYDSYGNQLFSRLNVQCNVPGNISIKGADTRIKNTDGTLDISLQTLGNNVREYTVNTHNKLLDVQSPLYFVENSNTATVIGFSGDGYVTEDKFEYDEHLNITGYDGSAFAGGQGDPEVNDLVHANSAEWNEVSAKLDTTAFSTVSGDFLTAIPEDYATKDYVQSSVSSKLDSTAFSTVSGDFLTAHQSLDGLMSASLLGMSGNTITSYNDMPFPIGGEGDAEVNQIVHANSGDWNNVSAKLDTTAFSTVSGNFLTAHQSLDGYLTKTSADTLYQPIGDYADATALDGKVDVSSFTAFSSTTNEKIEYISGALSGSYELSAGSGIDITDYPNEQKTVISVTAQGGNPEVENLVIANSATWDSVTSKADATALNDYATTAQLANKLDTTAFSTVSGSFLTAHQSLDGYATTQDVESAVSSKLDTTAFSTVSGNFLTAHQDLSDYQLTADMTAYQPAGSYLSADALDNVSADWNEVSAKLDTTAFSDVSGSFLTAVPDTYLQNTDLTIVDNKITEISGVPLSAGDELPEGLMNTSALEFNAVNEISGYNGSAIAQYGAEKQWLTHDDTIVHVSNSAQYAFGCNISALQRLMGIDETMLFSGTGATGAFSEPLSAFKKIEFHLSDDTMIRQVAILYPDDAVNGNYIVGAASVWQPNTSPVRVLSVSGNMNEFTKSNASYQWWAKADGGYSTFSTTPVKVVGIGRKS